MHRQSSTHHPAQIVVFPRMAKQPIDDRPGLRELADVVSLHLYSCVSACLSIEERAVVLKHLGRLCAELDKKAS